MIGTNTGHGHVWARPDGVKARCGGPGICHQCSTDAAALARATVQSVLDATPVTEAKTSKEQDMEPWETTTRYGRADLTLSPLVREAYKVACLIERCGASVELTRASSTAFDLCEKLSMELEASRALFNKGIGVLKDNRFSFSFENAAEAERAFHYVADLGTLQTSQPPKHHEMPAPASEERNPLAVNLEILGSLVRFAYANGYHELGYDVLAEAVKQLRGAGETGDEVVARGGDRCSIRLDNGELCSGELVAIHFAQKTVAPRLEPIHVIAGDPSSPIVGHREVSDRSEHALDDLAAQAQALDMGYGPTDSAPSVAGCADTEPSFSREGSGPVAVGAGPLCPTCKTELAFEGDVCGLCFPVAQP